MAARRSRVGRDANRTIGEIVGPAPTAPGDIRGAKQFLHCISLALEHDQQLTASERRALYKQRAKWIPRAKGEDARWMALGTSPGRPMVPKAPPRLPDARTQEEADHPLVAELERKFGRLKRPREQGAR